MAAPQLPGTVKRELHPFIQLGLKVLYLKYREQFDAVGLNMLALVSFMKGGPEPLAMQVLPEYIRAVLFHQRDEYLKKHGGPGRER